MEKNQEGFSAIETLFLLMIMALIGFAGWYVWNNNDRTQNTSTNISTGQSATGIDIEVITGEGGMPPGDSKGVILTGEEFTVVFTEPFSSLENWQTSKAINQVSTDTGFASIDFPAGKYGVYYIYKDQKTLYGDLTLENPRSDIQRDKQGPWYIEVDDQQRTKLRFSINPSPS